MPHAIEYERGKGYTMWLPCGVFLQVQRAQMTMNLVGYLYSGTESVVQNNVDNDVDWQLG